MGRNGGGRKTTADAGYERPIQYITKMNHDFHRGSFSLFFLAFYSTDRPSTQGQRNQPCCNHQRPQPAQTHTRPPLSRGLWAARSRSTQDLGRDKHGGEAWCVMKMNTTFIVFVSSNLSSHPPALMSNPTITVGTRC